jgi:hypothetical protein
MVHGVLGVCIQGAWDAQGEWQAGNQAATLEWTEGDFNYRIRTLRLGLTCADLLRIAGPDFTALSLEKPSFSKADSANSGVGPLGIPHLPPNLIKKLGFFLVSQRKTSENLYTTGWFKPALR